MNARADVRSGDDGTRGAAAPPALLEVRGLRKHLPVRGGILNRAVAWVKAVDDVDLEVRPGEVTVRFVSRDATVQAVNAVSFILDPGEVLCILGESGSGRWR